MAQIYLLRHEQRDSGCYTFGSGLNPQGQRKAETQVVERLRSLDPDVIVSSPYPRCLQTVLPYAREAGLPVHVDWGLAEAHPTPEEYFRWRLQDPLLVEDGRYELRPLLELTVGGVIERLCTLSQKYGDRKKVLFVTHQPVINAARIATDPSAKATDPMPYGYMHRLDL